MMIATSVLCFNEMKEASCHWGDLWLPCVGDYEETRAFFGKSPKPSVTFEPCMKSIFSQMMSVKACGHIP